jgi:integrase
VDEAGALLEPDASRTLPPMREADNVVVLGRVLNDSAPAEARARSGTERRARQSGSPDFFCECPKILGTLASQHRIHRVHPLRRSVDVGASDGGVGLLRGHRDGTREFDLLGEFGVHKGPSGPSPERSEMPATSRPTNGGLQVPSGPPVWAIVASYPKSTTPHPKAPAPNYQPPINPPQIDRPDPRLSALHAENQHLRDKLAARDAQLAAAQDALKLAACQAEAMRGLVGMLQGLAAGPVTPEPVNPPHIHLSTETVCASHSDMAQPQSPLRLAGTPGELDDLLASFGNHLKAKRKSHETVSNYPKVVRQCAGSCGWTLAHLALPDQRTRERSFQQIRTAVQSWLDSTALSEEWSSSTYNNKLSAIRAFFRWRYGEKNDPTEGITFHTEPRDEGMRAFELAEMRAIIGAALNPSKPNKRDPRRVGAYILSAHTALRKSNILLNPTRPNEAIRCGWIDFDERVVSVPAKDQKGRRKPLELPLDDDSVAVLKAFWPENPAPDAVIFPFWVDNRVLFDDMADAGVPRINSHGEKAAWHSWRKGFATAVADQGVSPRLAQALLGHSHVNTTMRHYTRADMSRKREAVDRLKDLMGITPKALAPHRTMVVDFPSPAGSRPMHSTPLASHDSTNGHACGAVHSRQEESSAGVAVHAVFAGAGSSLSCDQVRLGRVELPRGINPHGASDPARGKEAAYGSTGHKDVPGASSHPGAPAGATPARTGTPRVDGQPGTVATPNATSHAGEGPAAPLTQRMETEYHAHHDPRSPLGSVLQLRAPEAGRSVRDGHGQVADRSDRGSGEGGTGRGRGGLSGHRAPDPDAGCSAGGHAGITGGRLPEPPLNPDGDPITMMTAQERRDTLALIRRLLFPALVVLGTCAAAAAMNSTYEKPPVTLVVPE